MPKRKIEFGFHLYPTYQDLWFLSFDVKDRKSGDIVASMGADVTDDDIKQMIKTLKRALKDKENH